MINRGTLVWMVLAISAGIGLFVLKYDVKSMVSLGTHCAGSS